MRILSAAIVSVVGLGLAYSWLFPIESTDHQILYWLIVDKRDPWLRFLVFVSIVTLVVSVFTIRDDRLRDKAIIALILAGLFGCWLSVRSNLITTLVEHVDSARLGEHQYHLALRTEFRGAIVHKTWYELYQCDQYGLVCDRTDFYAPHLQSLYRRIEENPALMVSADGASLLVRVSDKYYAYRPPTSVHPSDADENPPVSASG